MAERFLIFNACYEPRVVIEFESAEKHTLGSKQDRVCRFCEKQEPVVTFQTDAHAISHLLGNNSIFTNWECDACNKFFSSHIENHLGNFTHPIRSVLKIRGKRGVPTIKSDSKESRIETKDGQLHIKANVNDNLVYLDLPSKNMQLEMRSAKMIPIAVYKALMKTALNIMLDDDIQYFRKAIEWIKLPHTKDNLPVNRALCLFGVIRGPLPENISHAMILRRRDEDRLVPYMMFYLQVANISFQIPIVLSTRDDALIGKEINVPRFPTGLLLGYEHGEPEYSVLNLSSTDEQRAEVTIEMQAEEMTPNGFLG